MRFGVQSGYRYIMCEWSETRLTNEERPNKHNAECAFFLTRETWQDTVLLKDDEWVMFSRRKRAPRRPKMILRLQIDIRNGISIYFAELLLCPSAMRFSPRSIPHSSDRHVWNTSRWLLHSICRNIRVDFQSSLPIQSKLASQSSYGLISNRWHRQRTRLRNLQKMTILHWEMKLRI